MRMQLPRLSGFTAGAMQVQGLLLLCLAVCYGQVPALPQTDSCTCQTPAFNSRTPCQKGHKLQQIPQTDRSAAPGSPAGSIQQPRTLCCLPRRCAHPSTSAEPQPAAPVNRHLTDLSAHLTGDTLVPTDWMMHCCSHMLLRQLYLPGTHDSGTYRWTTPQHMPLVLDELLAVLFNIVGDLSRTQHLSVYQQLQAGARVLDLRLAVNPWIALQARTSQHAAATSTGNGSTSNVGSSHPVLRLDPESLEGSLDWAATGGALTQEEQAGALVISHSLPAAPLSDVLADVRRFLKGNPGELVVLMVKADTVDVNVAAIQRMTSDNWVAAANMFREQLQGVQLLNAQQVQSKTLGELAVSSSGGGSVLLYSSDLQQQGLPAVTSKQLQILESWGNGTNTEDVGQLKQQLLRWLSFWNSASWRQNSKPFMLLASAEVTLGVGTILDMIKNRIWRWQQQQQPQQQQQQQMQHLHASQQQHLKQLQQQQQWQAVLGEQVLRLAAGVTTLYQLGVETNKQLLQELLQNNQVPKSFNVWSLDALSHDMANAIISLNNQPSTT